MSVALAVIQPAASCGQCGGCCRTIWTRVHPDHIDPSTGENHAFMAAHWSYAGETTNPDWKEGDEYPHYRYSCDQFDEARGLCLAHDSRPPICSGFPWYGEPPSAEQARNRFSTHPCTFWLDVPRAQRPVWFNGEGAAGDAGC